SREKPLPVARRAATAYGIRSAGRHPSRPAETSSRVGVRSGTSVPHGCLSRGTKATRRGSHGRARAHEESDCPDREALGRATEADKCRHGALDEAITV